MIKERQQHCKTDTFLASFTIKLYVLMFYPLEIKLLLLLLFVLLFVFVLVFHINFSGMYSFYFGET